ncbi:MAG: hypothetical protein KDB61_15970, partial [Planctomycetes bacterium]|nr:hypothetical protein [Planctomycetota bacterium]
MRLPTILLLALVIAALWLAFFGRDQPRRSAAELGPPPLTQAAKTSDQGTLADLAQPERREVTGDAAPSARAQPESLPESEGAPEEGWTRVAIQAWAGLESTPLGLVDVILKGEPTRPELSALYRYQ